MQRWPDVCCKAAMPLALLVTLLLFAQWPLRDGVGAWSTQANDLAQALFALYVAAALRHTEARQAHLVARPDLAGSTRWRRIGAPLCVLPWALFLVVSAAPAVGRSVLQLERFPETNNPGYFVIKVALILLALLLVSQSALDLQRALRRH